MKPENNKYRLTLPASFAQVNSKQVIIKVKAIVNDISFPGTHKFTILSDLFPVYGVFQSRHILVLAYTFWSIGLFISYLARHEKMFVLSGQFFMIKWLTVSL